MQHTAFPALDSHIVDWGKRLSSGNTDAFQKSLQGVDATVLFNAGLACAERGLLEGVKIATAAANAQDLAPQTRNDMIRRWLEGAILWEQFEVADYLRQTGVDPLLEVEASGEPFVSSSCHGRRTPCVDKHLKLIDQWSDKFRWELCHSGLMGLFLFRAIHHHSQACVEKLVEMGANLDLPHTSNGYRPLWAALRAGKAPLLELFLQKGASLELAGMMANKTLMVAAAERGMEPCIWALVQGGASLSDRSCGVDAPQSARAAGHMDLASRLEAHELQANMPSVSAGGMSRRL